MRMLTRKRSGEKSGKKILSILLAFIMIFSVLGMSGSTSLAQSKNGSTIRFGSSREIKDYKYSDISYNYAKLLQYSLYLYDANMCGPNVGSRSLLSWRGNCHTYDKTTYKRKDGKTVNVDVTGGFHDAGDHVKFGITEAYSATLLEMSYYTDKKAYESAGQTKHHITITDHFNEYLKKCIVSDASGNVEAFVIQVGEGNDDHNTYWGAPEKQAKSSGRKIYFASSKGDYSTDIVSLSSAALALHYMNYSDSSSLTAAKKLFKFAKDNPKATNKTAGSFYESSGWEDDYCLAATLLYNITGDSQYKNEYNKYSNTTKGNNIYWAISWDNVAPLIGYFSKDKTKLKASADVANNYVSNEGYVCLLDWGSARYNTALQYAGLLYDKVSGTSTYRKKSEQQMKFLLGNNSQKQCFVVGYNSYSPKYPHHEAASGYSFSELNQGTHANKYNLIGALVGGPKTDGSYADRADDYVYNEVAIDYNATLVAAAAAIYSGHIGESGQSVDKNLSSSKSQSSSGSSASSYKPPKPTKNQVVKTTYKGVTGWYYVQKGKVVPSFTGIASNKSGWWYIEKGKVTFKKNGIFKGTINGKTAWWYVKNSQITFTDTVAKNENGWWRIKNGMVDFSYTGIAKNEYGWWRIVGGRVDFGYTGVAQNEYGWFRVVGGKVDFSYTGIAKNEYGWWRIVGGKVDFNCNSVEKNEYGWFKLKGGKVDFGFTGIGYNKYGSWYCRGGKVDFSYSGNVYYNGRTYRISGGKVVN